MPVLSKCPVHGAFPSRILDIGDEGSIGQLVLSGNSESCPKCNRPSAVMEGTFSVRGGLIEILSAPQWTRDMLDRTKAAVQDAVEAVRADDQAAILSAIADLRREQSGLADLLQKAVVGKPKNRALKLLAGVLLAVELVSNAGSAVETVGDVVKVGADVITSITRVLDEGGEPTGEPGLAPAPSK
ncbi:hypothetical protein [Curtobacterium flaccumfaciens]|uniref:hypothetical protein n=1 Tax=Curtobacterium flaccumfaciens TaxID=2035 RepID=UPI001ADC8371|nr:hypothetical protein [Curtobacterium flaccumfaciens]MBO9043483.1 hypothetical protein [Curtobacterium flaccumfaciens pv. flaccumfaciens]